LKRQQRALKEELPGARNQDRRIHRRHLDSHDPVVSCQNKIAGRVDKADAAADCTENLDEASHF
jgi:hypothetical protein